ncbi:MAG: hypothetical protein O3B02_08520 [Proteobacteria bacterium]|nr:hypothetical protein [Pseudomonadota bacterium]
MSSRTIAVLLLAVSCGAGAHPHSTVEQQALLSLGRTQTVLSYLIQPSLGAGTHMFDHLDGDGNMQLDNEEKAAFARELILATTLTVNGKAVTLQLVGVALPDRATLAAGAGLLEVKVRTELSLDPAIEYAVALEVNHDQFAAAWYLQPHYFPDLYNGNRAPNLERFTNASRILIHIPGN